MLIKISTFNCCNHHQFLWQYWTDFKVRVVEVVANIANCNSAKKIVANSFTFCLLCNQEWWGGNGGIDKVHTSLKVTSQINWIVLKLQFQQNYKYLWFKIGKISKKGVPSEKSQKEMAVALNWCIFDLILAQPKCA